MEQNHCGHLGFPIDMFRSRSHPVATEQVSAQSDQSDQRFGKILKINFQDGCCGSHLGFSIYFVSAKSPNAP